MVYGAGAGSMRGDRVNELEAIATAIAMTGRSSNTFSGTRPMGDGTTDCSTTSGTNVTPCPPDNRSAGSRSNTAAPRTDAAPQ